MPTPTPYIHTPSLPSTSSPLQSIRANIKVSSTETGAIFGNLVYESTGYADRRCARMGGGGTGAARLAERCGASSAFTCSKLLDKSLPPAGPSTSLHPLFPLSLPTPPSRSVVVLNDIHIDIMDYIVPATCPDVQASGGREEGRKGKRGLGSARARRFCCVYSCAAATQALASRHTPALPHQPSAPCSKLQALP